MRGRERGRESMREMPFDRYPSIAADLIRDNGPAAASLAAEEHRQATIAGDAEGAAFWGLVRARVTAVNRAF